MYWEFLFNKVADLRPTTLLKRYPRTPTPCNNIVAKSLLRNELTTNLQQLVPKSHCCWGAFY